MNSALTALLQSKKFWVGMITIFAMLASLVLCIMGQVPVSGMATMMASLASVGCSIIGTIAWTDVTTAKLAAKPSEKKDDPS